MGSCYPTQAELGWGTPSPCWVEVGKGNRRSFAPLRMTLRWFGRDRFVLSHPSGAWMGHPFSVLGGSWQRQPQILRSTQDDIAVVRAGWVRATPPKRSLDGAPLLLAGWRLGNAERGSAPPTRTCLSGTSGMGHPIFVLGEDRIMRPGDPRRAHGSASS